MSLLMYLPYRSLKNASSRISPGLSLYFFEYSNPSPALRQGEPIWLLQAWEKATQERCLTETLNQREGVGATLIIHRGYSVNLAGGVCFYVL